MVVVLGCGPQGGQGDVVDVVRHVVGGARGGGGVEGGGGRGIGGGGGVVEVDGEEEEAVALCLLLCVSWLLVRGIWFFFLWL